MKQRPKAASGNNISLPATFNKLISDKEKEGRLRTADNYRSTLHKLQSYLGEAFDSLFLNDISDEWVAGYVRWLRKMHPDKPQTAGFYFRNTRTLYNRARKQFKFKQTADKDPFTGISFAGKQAAKRALTQKEINKLLNPELRGKLAAPLRESLDVLLFILFMRGMVFQDVYNLTWDAVAPDEQYLYDPNSPARNDERYIAVLRHIADSPHVGDIYKTRPKDQLEMALKNRPGDPAADFGYALADGTHESLYAVRAEYTLLVFYDPDCPGCREVTARMAASRLLRSWTAVRRRLSVLAVYPGEDTALWRQRKGELPDDWIVCCDSPRRISSDRLYDLRAFPTLYLLDKAKRVVLKDATFEAVEEWLEQHIAL